MGKFKESKIDYWLTDDGLMLIQAWKRNGDTDATIASKIGISYVVFSRWKLQNPEIAQALATSQEIVDYKVENALLKRALGFTSKEIKVTLGKKVVNGEVYNVLKETTTKEIAPDVSACMFWLNNRKFDQWRRNRDKTIEEGGEDRNVTITIHRGNPEKDGLGEEVHETATVKVTPNDKPESIDNDNDLDEWPDDFEE